MALTVRERVAAYDDRVRHGRVLVRLEVGPMQLAALEKLALLDVGDRDKAAIAGAVERYLDSATHISALGDSLWPASKNEAA